MKVGIVSDSHGQVDRLRRAIQELRARGCQIMVHCGDLGSPECLLAMGEAGVPAYAVLGNMDAAAADELALTAGQAGVHLGRKTVLVPLDGQTYLAVTHGHDIGALESLISEPQVAFVCYGHTHFRRDDRVNGTHVINPGALQRACPHTAAILDTEADTVEFVEVP